MTDWKAELDALVEETMAFVKNNPVEAPFSNRPRRAPSRNRTSCHQ
jgi:hypothetical protein